MYSYSVASSTAAVVCSVTGVMGIGLSHYTPKIEAESERFILITFLSNTFSYAELYATTSEGTSFPKWGSACPITFDSEARLPMSIQELAF